MKVGKIETITSEIPAKYLDKRILISERGRVNKSSIVPDLLSSAIILIVIAGIKIIKMKGDTSKKGIRLSSPLSNKFAPKSRLFGNTQCNKPEAIR
jgi:hypothetical protein